MSRAKDELAAATRVTGQNVVTEFFTPVLAAIEDVERRAALQLRFCLHNPQVVTPCCKAVHCFRWVGRSSMREGGDSSHVACSLSPHSCKIKDGHRGGETCEKVLAGAVELRACPKCNIAVAKSGAQCFVLSHFALCLTHTVLGADGCNSITCVCGLTFNFAEAPHVL